MEHIMDVDAILQEVRCALERMEPTGQAGELVFYDTPEEDASALRAELHLRDGAIAHLTIFDPRACARSAELIDPETESTARMIATLRAGGPPR